MDQGINPNFQSNKGRTLLHNYLERIPTIDISGEVNRLVRKMLIPLLIKKGADPHIPDSKGITPIHLAIKNNFLHTADFLYDQPISKRGYGSTKPYPKKFMKSQERRSILDIFDTFGDELNTLKCIEKDSERCKEIGKILEFTVDHLSDKEVLFYLDEYDKPLLEGFCSVSKRLNELLCKFEPLDFEEEFPGIEILE